MFMTYRGLEKISLSFAVLALCIMCGTSFQLALATKPMTGTSPDKESNQHILNEKELLALISKIANVKVGDSWEKVVNVFKEPNKEQPITYKLQNRKPGIRRTYCVKYVSKTNKEGYAIGIYEFSADSAGVVKGVYVNIKGHERFDVDLPFESVDEMKKNNPDEFKRIFPDNPKCP